MTQREALARLRGAQGLDDLTELVSRAAAATLVVDRSKTAWRAKPDRSPVSAADEAANAVIVQGLARLLPGVPIVSEEEQARPSALEAGFVLVDPLDGTREFLAGRDEFTVNVAIISQGRPTVGVIAAPALGLVWRGVAGQGQSASILQPGLRRTRPRGDVRSTRGVVRLPASSP
jgi:3'(2'), 5'-bisphosphate nucleotidase